MSLIFLFIDIIQNLQHLQSDKQGDVDEDGLLHVGGHQHVRHPHDEAGPDQVYQEENDCEFFTVRYPYCSLMFDDIIYNTVFISVIADACINIDNEETDITEEVDGGTHSEEDQLFNDDGIE